MAPRNLLLAATAVLAALTAAARAETADAPWSAYYSDPLFTIDRGMDETDLNQADMDHADSARPNGATPGHDYSAVATMTPPPVATSLKGGERTVRGAPDYFPDSHVDLDYFPGSSGLGYFPAPR